MVNQPQRGACICLRQETHLHLIRAKAIVLAFGKLAVLEVCPLFRYRNFEFRRRSVAFDDE